MDTKNQQPLEYAVVDTKKKDKKDSKQQKVINLATLLYKSIYMHLVTEFLIRSYGPSNGATRCPMAQYYVW